jgi:hypothetical protein
VRNMSSKRKAGVLWNRTGLVGEPMSMHRGEVLEASGLVVNIKLNIHL